MTSSSSPVEWPFVTVNILAFNRRDEVRETLRQLGSVDYPRESLEIIVVDNASTDGTSDMVEHEFPGVKVVTLHPNRAVAGWNAGFETGTGEYFLVLDDDSAPQSGLKDAITYLQHNPKIGILACQIVGGPFTTEKWKDKQNFIGFVGCGALISHQVVESIGGYAPWIHLYTHEWEYGLRCMNAGFEIRYFEDCVVRHRASEVNRSTQRSRVYSTRNELLIVHKFFASQRTLLLARTLFYNFNACRDEGLKTLLYVWRGFGMFLREARGQNQTFVRPEVQRKYVALYWSTQPVIGSIFKHIGKRLKARAR